MEVHQIKTPACSAEGLVHLYLIYIGVVVGNDAQVGLIVFRAHRVGMQKNGTTIQLHRERKVHHLCPPLVIAVDKPINGFGCRMQLQPTFDAESVRQQRTTEHHDKRNVQQHARTK